MSDEPKDPSPVIAESGKLAAEDIAKINLAMESAKGDRAAAAEILGVKKGRIDMAIQLNPALQARWRTPDELLAGETKINKFTSVNRTPPHPLVMTDAEKMAAALSVNERKMNRSLAKLGFKQEEINAISAVEEFAGGHFQETLSIMHGTMLQSGMRLMLLAKKIESQYLIDDGLEEKERRWWWDCYFKIIEQMRGMNTEVNKAALTRAIIEIKRKEQNGLGKPGFSTPAVAIQINNTGTVRAQSSGQTGEPTEAG